MILHGSVAATLAEAEISARAAGFREIILFDQTPLAPSETVSAATDRIRGNPLLGPRWLQVSDVIAVATQRLRTGTF